MKRLHLFIGTVLTVLLLAGGCSGKHKLVPGAPEWVNRGGGAYEEAGSRVFYGVGAVTGIASQPLAVQTADQRARADIARQIDTYVAALFRDFQTSTGSSAGKQVAEAQHVEESLKTFTQVTVRGARVVDHWKDPQTSTVYALARLDLEGIEATLEQLREMDPELRGFVRSNAEQAFDRIRLEEKGR